MAEKITPRAPGLFPVVSRHRQAAPAWPRTPTCAAAWSSSRTATPSGRRCSAPSTACSRTPATSTPTSRCSSPSRFLAKEEEMAEGFAKECAVVTHYRLKADAGQGPGRRSRGEARRRADHPARPPRRSSGTPTRTGSRATATCRCSSTSGATSSAGRCARGCSCAPPSSSGRRATPPTPRSRRPRRRRGTMLEVYRTLRRGVDGDAGADRPQERGPEVPRRRLHALHRGDDAGRQGAAGRHEPLPGPELRQGVRRAVPEPARASWSTPGRRAGASRRG